MAKSIKKIAAVLDPGGQATRDVISGDTDMLAGSKNSVRRVQEKARGINDSINSYIKRRYNQVEHGVNSYFNPSSPEVQVDPSIKAQQRKDEAAARARRAGRALLATGSDPNALGVGAGARTVG